MESFDQFLKRLEQETNAKGEVAFEAYLSETDPDRKAARYERYELLEKEAQTLLEQRMAFLEREAVYRAQSTGFHTPLQAQI